MKKILLAIDALNVHTASVDFASYIGRLTKSRLVGVFLENVLVDAPEEIYVEDNDRLSGNQRRAITDTNIAFFKQACASRGVSASIYRDRGLPASELMEESRYADLLIIEPSLSFRTRLAGSPSNFVKTILSEAECPVLIAPESFDAINEIIFAYDGSQSSVYAMKQFTYLFPEFENKKATIVQIQKDGHSSLTRKPKLKDWLKMHYTDTAVEMLVGAAADELLKFVAPKTDQILVMGAFGRGPISSFLRASTAELLIETTDLPLFIAHA